MLQILFPNQIFRELVCKLNGEYGLSSSTDEIMNEERKTTCRRHYKYSSLHGTPPHPKLGKITLKSNILKVLSVNDFKRVTSLKLCLYFCQ